MLAIDEKIFKFPIEKISKKLIKSKGKCLHHINIHWEKWN